MISASPAIQSGGGADGQSKPLKGTAAQEPEQLVFRGGHFARLVRHDTYDLGAGWTCDLYDYSTGAAL